MKIVTYNVNGLRPRISQYGSLLKLLNSLEADIICFQETKVARQDMTTDLITAEGYESFFSCTRTSDKGRVGYSGVATFCRVNSAFSSNEVALPLSAEEGFTGLLENFQRGIGIKEDEMPAKVESLQGMTKGDLLKLDSEGRCIITDHGHFILFNIYGPRAQCDDAERLQFKRTFFNMLQKRWESLLTQGKRIFVVGDLNIAPEPIDRCNAGPDFAQNEFRRWLRSMLVEQGGPFFDVFRVKHPERKEAYTCWSQCTGAEEFNYGSRIDHILIAGSCLHQDHSLESHNLIDCHVNECDIMTQFKRWKSENMPRWKGGRNTKLEGSDHAPVYISFREIPNLLEHNTPSLSARYVPGVHGFQQTIVSLLMKRQISAELKKDGTSQLFSDENIIVESCSASAKRSLDSEEKFSDFNPQCEGSNPSMKKQLSGFANEGSENSMFLLRNKTTSGQRLDSKKKVRHSGCSQRTLSSFFQKQSSHGADVVTESTDTSLSQVDVSERKTNSPCLTKVTNLPRESQEVKESDSPKKIQEIKETDSPKETPEVKETDSPTGTQEGDESNGCKMFEVSMIPFTQSQGDENASGSSEKEKNDAALLEWRRIQQFMQNSVPLCKGHKEPCVARVVKKAGPNLGRRFYVCARAEGPAFNLEANCGITSKGQF
ncbi:DNA-(apurinic or apyrimidinic site) endonuclease 2 isoform X2 [Telopea speciosissima]|uniref:DNA-(apurinic or apyrimidinic site) endonuclease 2 isoform X2 n=1 Tax=Telopea speciosissima TaxID=54955 RepID=UPI001CC5D7FD|nr:DNA-(apurinic or apyrimidinic site) endonuclease 2 isoform X2 [Telopea speciosissima]